MNNNKHTKYDIGTRWTNKDNQSFIIVGIIDTNNRLIKFEGSNIIKQTSLSSIRRKTVTETSKIYHGESQTSRLYRIWKAMHWRCNPKNKNAMVYKTKHIIVCEEWNNYLTFKEWALSHGYQDNLTIDRIDSNDNYCPSNCRWVTASDNSRRIDKSKESHRVVRVDNNGKIFIFNSEREAARCMKRDRKAIKYRLKGYNNHYLEGYYWYYENDYEVMKDEYKTTI